MRSRSPWLLSMRSTCFYSSLAVSHWPHIWACTAVVIRYASPPTFNALEQGLLKNSQDYVRENGITNGSYNMTKRCREEQAVCAFLWFGFAAWAASLILSVMSMRGGTSGLRRGTHQVALYFELSAIFSSPACADYNRNWKSMSTLFLTTSDGAFCLLNHFAYALAPRITSLKIYHNRSGRRSSQTQPMKHDPRIILGDLGLAHVGR